jgi:subtilisin-like proprotein convertase family protein
VTITVWDNGGAPLADVEITIDGWGMTAQVDVTDGAGEAHFSLTPPYGEDLTVIASEIGEVYNCFEDVVPVTGGMALTVPDIDASVASIGLFGSLAPHYEGSIVGSADETGLMLYAAGCGVDASAGPGGTSVEILATPNSAGTIVAALALGGYDVYLEDVIVQVVYGTLSGTVYDAVSAPVADAVVKGYPAGSDTTGATPVFRVVTGGGGAYAIGDDLEVGYYDVYISKFGYLTGEHEIFIQYGANAYDFYLDSAPAGVVSGTVTELGTGTPLEATVKVYRSDDGSLYAETTSDAGTGYYEVTLPYFNYQMNVRAYHHIPENRGISVSTPTMTENFVLDVTLANILVISDGVRGEQETHKVDEAGNTIYFEGASDNGRSAAQISIDLVALGYDVTEEDAATTDPGTWLSNYDFILWASGDNTSPVEVQAYRDNLEAYVAAGGKLLIEGGEIAYDAVSYPGYPTFAANVLHSADWNHDSSGSLTPYDGSHPINTFPNTIGTIAFTYDNYGDQDASLPTADAATVCTWTTYPTDASVIVYDDTPNPTSGQIVFFQFDYLAGEDAGMLALLENAVTYLMTPETPPDGSIAGTVTLAGETDHSGVLVELSPGGDSVITGPTGEYEFAGLYDNVYSVTASKLDWATATVTDIVVSGAPIMGIDMTLYPIATLQECSTPGVAIPPEDPAGIYETITLTGALEISELEVYVDISHTAIGELFVELTSPEGTTVRLHSGTGTFADDIIGWYDSELTCDGPGTMADFVGEEAAGVWTLWVADNISTTYFGTLNEWCVKAIGGELTGVDEELSGPSDYALRGVSPNPFNPVTNVSYGAPTDAHVKLAIYNVAGRLVRTLVDRQIDAGYHVAVWDGRDDNGVEVGSGVYFCRMEAEGFGDAAKMVLLK